MNDFFPLETEPRIKWKQKKLYGHWIRWSMEDRDDLSTFIQSGSDPIATGVRLLLFYFSKTYVFPFLLIGVEQPNQSLLFCHLRLIIFIRQNELHGQIFLLHQNIAGSQIFFAYDFSFQEFEMWKIHISNVNIDWDNINIIWKFDWMIFLYWCCKLSGSFYMFFPQMDSFLWLMMTWLHNSN